MRIDRNIEAANKRLIDAFVSYLWTDEAQDRFAAYGFRSVREERNAGFVRIVDPFLIADFGGWKRAKKEIVDAVWKTQVMKEGH